MFRDRTDAGRQLGQRVALAMQQRHDRADDGGMARSPLVLGLPRGGVIVAAEVARALRAALDVFVVRKIGAPFQPELAIGAVADVDGRAEVVLNDDLLRELGVDEAYVQREAEAEHQECLRRLREYRGDRPAPVIEQCDVVVVDDGIATGATMMAALQVLRRQQPQYLMLAVPVAPPETLREMRKHVDEVVCLTSPPYFTSVGAFYQCFAQTTDQQVIAALANAAR